MQVQKKNINKGLIFKFPYISKFLHMAIKSPQHTTTSAKDDGFLRSNTVHNIIDIMIQKDPINQVEQARTNIPILLLSTFQAIVVGWPTEYAEFHMTKNWTRCQYCRLFSQSQCSLNIIYLLSSSRGCHADSWTVLYSVQSQTCTPLHHLRSEGFPMGLTSLMEFIDAYKNESQRKRVQK